jgi:hypothetical protein
MDVVRSDAVLGAFPEIRKDLHKPVTEGGTGERIVIVLPGGTAGTQFQLGFPRICIFVPMLTVRNDDGTEYGVPDNVRLGELEDVCNAKFGMLTVGKAGDEVYTCIRDEITQDSDYSTWSVILNVRLRFEVINTGI